MPDARINTIAMTARLDLNVPWPTKNALLRVAQGRQISLSDVVRQSLLAGLPFAYPEFDQLHDEEIERYLHSEVTNDRPDTAE